MIKKTVIWVCVLVFAATFACPAFADQSIAYQQYYNEGVRAFKEHDDQKALRCFKIAQIYDPNDADLQQYLSILEQRGVALQLPAPQVPPDQSVGYRYYLKHGITAFEKHDYKKAIHDLTIAVIFNPDSKEADHYLRMLSTPSVPQVASAPVEQTFIPQNIPTQPEAMLPQPAPAVPAAQAFIQPQPQAVPVPQEVTVPQEVSAPQPVPALPAVSNISNIAPQQAQAVTTVQPQSASAAAPKPTLYVAAQQPKHPPTVVQLSQLTASGQSKPTVFIELHSSVIIESKNIQRFLVVDEGFIGVKTIDTDHIEIDALRIGTTFLHIWDDSGRHTFYVEIVFPKTVSAGELEALNTVQHSQPFRFTYTSDWSTYYTGRNASVLKRQSYDFNQTLGVTGETPYGYFDASGSYTDFDSVSDFDSYTVGLSQIPLEGTSNFNLRGLDALRYLSPLTMPSTRMRGVFADVDLMQDMIGLSVSHGQEQPPLGFVTLQGSQFNNSYIDAVKLTLFPRSETDRYSFNFATGYGPDREPYLSNHVYSVEGQHKFNDFLTLNAEEASDSSHDSSLASLKWEDGGFRSGLHFRSIDKDYSTVSTLPSYQGETGASWTTETDLKNITASSFVETYRDHLDFNPDDATALNYDANGHVKVNITRNLWNDLDFNYVDTPGELSPHRSLGLNDRLSRSFGVWNSLKATVFAGGGYQNSHSSDSDISDFDRKDVIAGIEVPLTSQVSVFSNYEYDWLSQPADAGGDSTPSIINAGIEYQKQFNPKFSVTSQAVYRDELGVNGSNNSFLSGERSVILSSSFNYNPTQDISIFADGDASKVMYHTSSSQPYDDFEVHVGVKINFGGATYWDPLGTVSGIVFKDRNGDGKFAAGDEGIGGIKVKVGDKVVTTDKNGRYSVQVRAKGVQVTPVLDTVPGGLMFSTPQALNVEVIQGRRSKADFGLTSQTGIYGIVFVDKNGSGVPNSNDKFIGKVKVVLDGKTIQKSDPHGAFYFRKVAPGEHSISIDINTLSLDMVPMVKLKNKIDVTEGTNYMFNIPVQIKKAEGDQS